MTQQVRRSSYRYACSPELYSRWQDRYSPERRLYRDGIGYDYDPRR